MKNLSLVMAVTCVLFLSQPVHAAATWQTIEQIHLPIYYGINTVCFLANWPVAGIVWVNKHIRTHIHHAAIDEANENAIKGASVVSK